MTDQLLFVSAFRPARAPKQSADHVRFVIYAAKVNPEKRPYVRNVKSS